MKWSIRCLQRELVVVSTALVLSACGGGKELGGTDTRAKASAAESPQVLLTRAAALNSAELQRAAGLAKAAQVQQALAKIAPGSLVVAHRFYNTETGAHFYTISAHEKETVEATLSQFRYEGPAFWVSADATSGLSPVHRFFNRQTGVHFYTISEDEKAFVEVNLPQFRYEGVAYHASQVAGAQFSPLFRFYLRSKGYHFYSASPSERDRIVGTLPQYRFEGPGYHVVNLEAVSMPTFAIAHSGITDHQCHQAGSNNLVACTEGAATELHANQDGHRATTTPLVYSEVPNPNGGHFDRTECVKDERTGLIWEGKTASGPRAGSQRLTHYDDPTQPQRLSSTGFFVNPTQAEIDAETNSVGYTRAVNTSALCGFTDWRLPTIEELHSVVDYGVANPGPTYRADWFPNAAAAVHLASQPFAGPTTMWVIDFRRGEVTPGLRFGTSAVRLVRSDAPVLEPTRCPGVPTAVRFEPNGEEITDRKTGLVWARCSAGQTFSEGQCSGMTAALTHEEALAYAETQAGWRLPTVKELAGLLERRCPSVAIDSAAFPNTIATEFWTSTPNVSDPSRAWTVDFSNSRADTDDRTFRYPVRLLRSGP